MTPYQTLETQLSHGVAIIWLNRPDIRNAMSDTLIAELTDAFAAAAEDEDVRAIVLAGHGKAFCAGADLNWMQRAADYTHEQNLADAQRLATLLDTIARCPKPTVARVHGPAYAGGMGLVAACDVAIASTEATFCLSEVKLGLIPATISPYVIRAMGQRAARRWFLSGEVFDAAEAYRIGFVHDLCPAEELDGTVNALLGQFMLGSPQALASCKRLIDDVAGRPVDAALIDDTARRIADARASDDGREGLASFLDKRKPRWVPQA